MRVYNSLEFLKLPVGTFFCKGVKWCFDNLSIKGCTSDSHFRYVDLCNIDSFDSRQWVDRLEDSLKNGTSFPINKDTSLDSCIDKESVFLVFEEKDLEFLRRIMKNSINNEEND